MNPIDAAIKYRMRTTDECGLGVDWDDAKGKCWRCGTTQSIQVHHIKPRSLGGENVPENLSLLCEYCHQQAPHVPDEEFFWMWIRKTNWSEGLYRMIPRVLLDGMRMYKTLYGDYPHNTTFPQELFDSVADFGCVGAASLAWIMHQALNSSTEMGYT